MTKSELYLPDSAFIGPGLLFLNQYFNSFVDEYIVLLIALVSWRERHTHTHTVFVVTASITRSVALRSACLSVFSPPPCAGALPGGPDAVLHRRVSPDRRAPAHPGVQHHTAQPRPPRLTACPSGEAGGGGGGGGDDDGDDGRPPSAPGSRPTRGQTFEPKPQQP